MHPAAHVPATATLRTVPTTLGGAAAHTACATRTHMLHNTPFAEYKSREAVTCIHTGLVQRHSADCKTRGQQCARHHQSCSRIGRLNPGRLGIRSCLIVSSAVPLVPLLPAPAATASGCLGNSAVTCAESGRTAANNTVSRAAVATSLCMRWIAHSTSRTSAAAARLPVCQGHH